MWTSILSHPPKWISDNLKKYKEEKNQKELCSFITEDETREMNRMDVTDILESEYLNVAQIEKAEKKTGLILNSGEMEENSFNEGEATQSQVEKRFTLLIDFNGKTKKYRPNKDSLSNLAQAYGTETTGWAEKPIKFTIVTVNGQKRISACGVEA